VDPSATTSIRTPCSGVCRLDPAGYCLGCRRTATEIAEWIRMADSERVRLMEVELPRR
jgi:uncharacterized protein